VALGNDLLMPEVRRIRRGLQTNLLAELTDQAFLNRLAWLDTATRSAPETASVRELEPQQEHPIISIEYDAARRRP
jgi:hypothetical protein